MAVKAKEVVEPANSPEPGGARKRRQDRKRCFR